MTQCDLMRLFEEDIKNWHFKFNILFNIQETFWHQNDFHIIFLSKVIYNLISNCLITLKINYQDTGRQSYWFVHKHIEDIKNNWIQTKFPVTYWLVWVYELIEFMSKIVFKHTVIFEKFWPHFTFLLLKINLLQSASLAGVGSQLCITSSVLCLCQVVGMHWLPPDCCVLSKIHFFE